MNKIQFPDLRELYRMVIILTGIIKINIFTSLITLKEGFTHAKLHLSLKHSCVGARQDRYYFPNITEEIEIKYSNIFKKVKITA